MKLRVASIVVATAILAGADPSVQVHLAAQGKGASQAEPDTDLDGTLEVLFEDGYDAPRLKHFLRTASDRVELDFGGRGPRNLQTGTRVRARGKLRNGKLALNPLDVAALGGEVAALGGGSGGGSGQALVSPNTFGVQSTLVILFNFQDLVQQPYTTSLANTVTFTQVNNFDLENSFQQTSLTGTVVGWYTIASSATAQGCNYNVWAAQAEAAATAAGVNLSLYPRRVFGFPQTSACSWWGLGSVGGGDTGNPSRAWINGTYSLRVVAHEMGHNFGLYHSRSNTCDSTNGCFVDEYGDDHDVMGGGPSSITGHFNAYQKERIGWLNFGSSPTIATVTGSGQYALEPYAKPWTGGAKALKILKSTNGASNTYIYAEART
ncbi:MAG TPA: M12 family metallo-peptidase, partial [Vicinamibacterales bacterium]